MATRSKFNIYAVLANTYFEKLKVPPPFLSDVTHIWLHHGVYIYYTKFPDKCYKYLAIYDKNDNSIIYFPVTGPHSKQGQSDFQETVQKRFRQRMCRL